jgi:hypothetical protein
MSRIGLRSPGSSASSAEVKGETMDNGNVEAQVEQTPDPTQQGSRRQFLMQSARRIGYVAPVVLLFHPRRACASNGSTLTYWDGAEVKTQPHTPGAEP